MVLPQGKTPSDVWDLSIKTDVTSVGKTENYTFNIDTESANPNGVVFYVTQFKVRDNGEFGFNIGISESGIYDVYFLSQQSGVQKYTDFSFVNSTEYKQTIDKLNEKINDKTAFVDMFKNPGFCLLAKDGSKHYPSELVVSTDDIYEDCHKLCYSINEWVDEFKKINIENIEIETNRKILMMEDGIVLYGDYDNMKNEFGLLMEPFVFGDTFGFTIYRDSLTYEEIINIYKYYKEELNIKFEFHIKDGYYDTNDWCRGNKLFFRGHCIDILSNYHKDKNPLKKMLTK
jgi:hypothetical protein